MKKNLSDFNFFTRMALRTITSIQKLAIKYDSQFLYYALARLHFLIWFGLSLDRAVRKNSYLSKLAARRHATIVVKSIYKNATPKSKARIRRLAQRSFVNNILLNQKL